jgi:hypothetical protein
LCTGAGFADSKALLFSRCVTGVSPLGQAIAQRFEAELVQVLQDWIQG